PDGLPRSCGAIIRGIDQRHVRPPVDPPPWPPPPPPPPKAATPDGRGHHRGYGPWFSGAAERFGHGEWRRSRDDRLFGGVAGGMAKRFRIDSTLVRIAFVVAAVIGGFGFIAYLAAWLVMPMEGQTRSIGARAVRDRHGMLLSLAFLPALIAVLIVGAGLHLGFVTSMAWPVFIGAAALVLLWRNTDAEE